MTQAIRTLLERVIKGVNMVKTQYAHVWKCAHVMDPFVQLLYTKNKQQINT
jgi:hypothetical protein